MFTKLSENRSKFSARLSAFALAGMALLVTNASVSANPQCRKVEGRYAEQATTENCMSPVGLCIAGEYQGDVSGNFFGTATALIPSADTGTTAVVFFTSDSVIHARINNKQGDLIIKNAGAFQTAGAGNIVDVQYITGGTGDFSGVTGVIRASGTFDSATGMGQSKYEGEICRP